MRHHGRSFNNHLIANFLPSMPVKFLKLAN